MNSCQAKAQALYDKNKQAVESGIVHNTEELAKLVKEQARLQVFINSRVKR